MNYKDYNALLANLANDVDNSDMEDVLKKFAEISTATGFNNKVAASLLLILTELASRIRDLENRDNVTYH